MKNELNLTFEEYSKKDRTRIFKLKEILKDDCFMDASVVDLEKYYRQEKGYFRNINKKQKQAILELAKIKHEQNVKEADVWARNGLFYLACEQLTKMKKAKKVVKNVENWYYKANINEVVICMGDIIANMFSRTNNQNELREQLHLHCQGVSDEFKRILK